jgi:hypothetical protein
MPPLDVTLAAPNSSGAMRIRIRKGLGWSDARYLYIIYFLGPHRRRGAISGAPVSQVHLLQSQAANWPGDKLPVVKGCGVVDGT